MRCTGGISFGCDTLVCHGLVLHLFQIWYAVWEWSACHSRLLSQLAASSLVVPMLNVSAYDVTFMPSVVSVIFTAVFVGGVRDGLALPLTVLHLMFMVYFITDTMIIMVLIMNVSTSTVVISGASSCFPPPLLLTWMPSEGITVSVLGLSVSSATVIVGDVSGGLPLLLTVPYLTSVMYVIGHIVIIAALVVDVSASMDIASSASGSIPPVLALFLMTMM